MKKLSKAAEARGHSNWARGPHNAGNYNSRPQDTGFFRDGGDYDSYYGRFFLKWYSNVLIEHGDRVLTLAKLAFEDVKIAAKVGNIFMSFSQTPCCPEVNMLLNLNRHTFLR